MKIPEKHIDRMLGVAHYISNWSLCPAGRRHGCVLTYGNGKYILSTGYNGLLYACKVGAEKCSTLLKAQVVPICEATHAEINALCNRTPSATNEAQDVVAFVTKKPCGACMLRLSHAGVKMVYWEERDLRGVTKDSGFMTF